MQCAAKYAVDFRRLAVEVRLTAFDHRNGSVAVDFGNHLGLVVRDLYFCAWMITEEFCSIRRDLFVSHDNLPRGLDNIFVRMVRPILSSSDPSASVRMTQAVAGLWAGTKPRVDHVRRTVPVNDAQWRSIAIKPQKRVERGGHVIGGSR
jgi:hypothetical protein